jgi:hypothetical protein
MSIRIQQMGTVRTETLLDGTYPKPLKSKIHNTVSQSSSAAAIRCSAWSINNTHNFCVACTRRATPALVTVCAAARRRPQASRLCWLLGELRGGLSAMTKSCESH